MLSNIRVVIRVQNVFSLYCILRLADKIPRCDHYQGVDKTWFLKKITAAKYNREPRLSGSFITAELRIPGVCNHQRGVGCNDFSNKEVSTIPSGIIVCANRKNYFHFFVCCLNTQIMKRGDFKGSVQQKLRWF
jgi:hypothetical protein